VKMLMKIVTKKLSSSLKTIENPYIQYEHQVSSYFQIYEKVWEVRISFGAKCKNKTEKPLLHRMKKYVKYNGRNKKERTLSDSKF
jgi:hypothetical protein